MIVNGFLKIYGGWFSLSGIRGIMFTGYTDGVMLHFDNKTQRKLSWREWDEVSVYLGLGPFKNEEAKD